MNSKTDAYRANAIRVLIRITDATMLAQIERHLKQAVVDKVPYVSSAALVSAIHLMGRPTAEIVKRWGNEAQEACNSKGPMVQYHALGLLYQIKKNDRLAVSKMVQSMIKGQRSPFATAFLIKLAARAAEEDPNPDPSIFEFLETSLRNRSEIVIYEAARALCSLRSSTVRELTPAITVLQLLLSSPKATLRFAAVRTLNKVANAHPAAVSACNIDLEHLITDSNRSIATLAITTLLKTGSESNIDRLLKQISSFMAEIADEFKIVVVEAIRTLCLKFPAKHRTMITFLSTVLRDEGGYEYKKMIVEALLTIISAVPESKEAGLSHLCEFIEDCEFNQLLVRILHVLGREGPTTKTPSKYIRYINNRVLLENALVRASGVDALGKFGIALESLRPTIVLLLRRCLHDLDDEVRDRATFYLRILETQHDKAQKIASQRLPINTAAFERMALEYRKNPTKPFSFNNAELFTVSKTAAASSAAAHDFGAAAPAQSVATAAREDTYGALLRSVPQFASFGPVWTSSAPVELTEAETEYVVNVVKHVFARHIVLQYNITNTLNDQLLCDVTVDVASPEGLAAPLVIPAAALSFDTPGVVWVACEREDDSVFPTGTFTNTLKFTVKDVDTATGEAEDDGYQDEYQVEEFELSTCDYMQKLFVRDFKTAWEGQNDNPQVVETFGLTTIKSIKQGVKAVIEFLGMQPCERSDETPEAKNQHVLLLSGTFVGGVAVLARVRLVLDQSQGVNMELTVRSESEDVNQAVAAAIA
eukprot:TRINITY_DN1880_c0_g1_i1.p1 TRINITY_DN1880_c0_g1~~TRINITY_DN1880_c0_g1_i1.p1  ORF type:complete len:878 (+),score=230.27 TRINITY_DN1880_c0_g1_i1:347-2635(+)